MARLAAFLLDKHGAPKLSELTACGAPEIDEPPNYLGSMVMNSIFSVTYAEPFGRLMFMSGRRAEQAIREYRTGRELLLSYVNKLSETNTHLLVAMRATTHFEQCIASTAQAGLLLGRIIKKAHPRHLPPELPDDREDRIKLIWNRSKHFEEDLADPKTLDAQITAPVWLTNEGIECTRASVTFVELKSALTYLMNTVKFVAEDMPKQLVESVERRPAENDAAG